MRLGVLLVVRFAEICVAQSATTGLASRCSTMCRSRGIQPPRVDCRRQPAADAMAMEFAAPAGWVVAFGARHGPQPSVPRLGSHERKRVRPGERLSVEVKLARAADDAPEVMDRPRSRHQWPPLPASQRFRAVWWLSGSG